MEICDVLNESGARIGKTVARGTKLEQGEYFLAVQVWIKNESGEYLIQQRAANRTFGGMWATTAGMVISGEESVDGAIRESMEELGIELSPEQLTRFMRLVMKNQIEDVWIATVSKDAAIPSIGDEVSACKWASKREIAAMIEGGEFFGYNYFASLPE